MHANRLATTLLLLATGVLPARAAIIGEFVGVGFPSIGGFAQGRDLVRPGDWTAVAVDLRLQGAPTFDGWIRIAQPDKDGDRCYDAQRVQLLGDRDESRRYWLYVVAGPNPSGPNAFSVEILDAEGTAVEIESNGQRTLTLEPTVQPEALMGEEFLVLSVSTRSPGKLLNLEQPDQSLDLARPVRAAHIAPAQLPDRWLGLESVDAVVWDDADPADLSPAQLDALIKWTRQGGQLVIAAARTSDAVAANQRLADVLPVKIGPVVSTASLHRMRRTFLTLNQDQQDYPAPIPVAQCDLLDGADATVRESIDGTDRPLITQQRTGRGRLTYVAASLRDLLIDGNAARFYVRLLELRERSVEFRPDPVRVIEHIDAFIGFRQIGAAFLGLAMIFAGLYVFAATFGSWGFLRRRNWTRHSWSAFAVVAILASVVGVAAVQVVRGIGRRLVQLSVVDASANRAQAYATAYFGIKTGLFGALDLWVPDEFTTSAQPEPTDAYVKPLASSRQFGQDQQYADPGRYRLDPARAVAFQVPIRGTLKQLQGQWSGPMAGRVAADIRTYQNPESSYDVRLTNDCLITNQLGVDLYGCQLLYAAADVYVPNQPIEIPQRADKIYRVPIGDLANGQSVQPALLFHYRGGFSFPLAFDDWKDKTLKTAQKQWRAQFDLLDRAIRTGPGLPGITAIESALLMATTVGDYEPPDPANRWQSSTVFSLERCRRLDISRFIDTRTALFVGFAHNRGPVRLCTRSGTGDFDPVDPTAAVTMYRILIPVNNAASANLSNDGAS